MKHYKLFLLFGLWTLLFAACNTDDLEKDIDALNERVTNMEAQVQSLNDNMNIVRVMLDGNKTITNYSVSGEIYTLTLSNGETLTLTPGVVGSNNPPISISEAGTWVIDGKDTGKRALATNGVDAAVTPQFKIENNAWWVSYDNGVTWTQLANGLPIGTNDHTNPISNVEVKDNNLTITMNGTEYQIPIVSDLVCAIEAPEELKNGVWMIAQGAGSVFRMTVSSGTDDVVRVKVPVEWKVIQGTSIDEDGMVSVTITPPVTASECIITVEVTRGVYTVTDQLRVRTVTDSYYADYLAGFDIMIGDVIVNKFDNPGATLVEDGGTISGAGCYFIKDGATVTLSSTNEVTLVAEKKTGFTSKVQTTIANLAISGNLLCRGISLTSTQSSKNLLSLGGSTSIGKVYFDHCNIILPDGMNFAYFSGGTGIDYLRINSCYISLPPVESRNFLNLQSKIYGTIELKNNLFYCNQENRYTCFNFVMGTPTIDVLTLENNTFINQATWESRMMNLNCKGAFWTIKNNLFWYNSEKGPSGNATNALINQMEDGVVFNGENFTGNQVYTSQISTAYTWKVFYNNPPQGFINPLILTLDTTPFVDGSVPHEGNCKLKPEYEKLGVGAVID